MNIVRLPEYEAEFESEEFEIYVLPRSDANGASPYLKTPKYLHTDRGDFLLNREFQRI